MAASPKAARALMDWAFRTDVRDAARHIQVPTLVLHVRDSPVFPAKLGRDLAERIPGAELVIPPGGDTALYGQENDELLDAIETFLSGVRPVRQPDRVLATVLFTDIVASTESVVRVGDKRWMAILDDHDTVTSRELLRHRGRKVNPTGDGMLAVFDLPGRAVHCAQAICAAMARLGIRVRAGVHTGEIELRGDDIGGIAVHIGQRVSALAAPGEVLVTRTISDLVAGSGIEFTDRGEHELKGVPGSWRLFRVTPQAPARSGVPG